MEMEINQDLLDILYSKFASASFDSYLLVNHRRLANLFNLTASLLGIDIKIPFHTVFSRNYVLQLEECFLNTLCPKYGNRFKSDAKNIVQTSFGVGHYYRNFDTMQYKIYYPKESNIKDFVVLSHEYTHHLCAKFPREEEDTSAYKVYCETLTQLSELKSLDLLMKNGFSKYDINAYLQHMRSNFDRIFITFSLVQPLLDVYLCENHFQKKEIFNLFEIHPFYRFLGIQNMINNISALVNEDIEACFSSYPHLLGIIWASTLHQDGISNEDFVQLIEIINEVEVEQFEFILPDKSNMELASATQKEFCYRK